MNERPERWYSIHGRITRLTWITRVLGALALALGTMVAAIQFGPRLTEHDALQPVARVASIGLIVGFLVFRFIQDIKRLHDLGYSGWFVFGAAIPIVNLIYVIMIVGRDGEPFANAYGPDPKGRGAGVDADAVADVFR